MSAAGKVRVISNLRNDVGMHVGCAWVIGGVKLYPQCSIELERENCFTLADVLLRIFHSERQGPMLIRMIAQPESGLARPGEANLIVGIHVARAKDVARIGRYTNAI